MTDEQNNTNNENNNENQNDDSQNNDNSQDNREPETFDYGVLLDDDNSGDDAGDNSGDDNDAGDDGDDSEGKKQAPKSNQSNNVLNKVNEHFVKQAVTSEVDKYFQDNPEAKEFRSTVEKWVNHPNRMKFIKQGMPVSAVIAEALAPHQQKIGAIKARNADNEANQNKDGGQTPPAKSPGKMDFSTMPLEDVKKMANDVMNGRWQGKI